MRKVMTIMALAALFCGVSGFAAEAENSPIRSKKITRPIEVETPKYFVSNPFGYFTGTVESATPTRVKFRLPSGKVFEVPMFYLGAPPVHHVMSTMAKIPQKVTDYQMDPGRNFGGEIAKMQMWRGVLSDEEIAKMAKAAHERVVIEEAKKE